MKLFLVNDTTHSSHPGSIYSTNYIMDMLSKIGPTEVLSLGTYPPIDEIENSIAIINGEGTLHGEKWTKRIEWVLNIMEKFEGRSVVINASVYNFDSGLSHLSTLVNVFVRESLTKDYLQSHGLDSSIAPDVTLTFPAITGNPKKRTGIGVSDSSSIWNSRKGYVLSRLIKAEYKRLDNKRFVSPTGFASKAKQLANSYLLSPRISDFKELCDWTASKTFVFTGRFHVVTACILTQTPFSVIGGGEPKIGGLLRDSLPGSRKVIRRSWILGYWLGKKLTEAEKSRFDGYIQLARNSQLDVMTKISRLLASLGNSQH